jgi:alanyl-tRNA synthetase
MSIVDAKKKGAMALFGEKYGDQVRVVNIGPHSTELCGGTHVSKTGDIGSFRILSEGPLAAGIRRIEAVAGLSALSYAQQEHQALSTLSKALGVPSANLAERVNTLLSDLKHARKQLEQFQSKESSHQASLLVSKARAINGVQVIAEKLKDVDPKLLQSYADELRNHLKSGLVVLGLQTAPDKCSILVALTPDLVSKYHAGKLVGELAQIIGGKGGGRPDFAQAGGSKPEKLDEALKQLETLL